LGHWLGPVIRLGWIGPAPPHGLGWAQPEKKEKKKRNFSSKIISKKICDFLQIFYCILINIDLYFYTVKIQIQY
jgi:hypothetical protein